MSPQPAKFAGSFFTAEPIPLNRQVRLLIEAGRIGAGVSRSKPVAIISPHAGYRFSGAIAGQAFAAARTHDYKRIVILSPSHRYAFDGLAMPSWSRIQMPNGVARVDHILRNHLRDKGLVRIETAAHDNEHGIETQLPFIVRYFREAKIVPVVCGRATVAEVARFVDYLADPDTLFVVSTDLSHFLDHDASQQMDAETARMIETANIEGLDRHHACGWLPLAGFLASDTGAGARVVRLALGDSVPVNQDTSRVVGYGAWACFPAGAEVFAPYFRTEMLQVARKSLASRLRRGRPPEINLPSFRAPLLTHMASFVTLNHKGRLRGCIGSLKAHQPLIQDVIENAIKAGTQDARFKPLTDPAQLDDMKIKIALLSKPAPISVKTRADLVAAMIPGVTGAILQDQNKRGTFLPMVWDSLPTPEKFVDGLMVKAGLPKDHWSDTVRVWTYRAESFAEPDD